MFGKNFSKDSNLDDLYTSLSVVPYRTNMKLHNISVPPKMVKKVIANLASSNSSGPDCILVVILKNCEPELSYILAELLNICLKEPCFPDCRRILSVVLVFKNVRERSASKNYHPAQSSFCGWWSVWKTCKEENYLSSWEIWSFFWFPV